MLDWENGGPLDAGRELGYVLQAWAATGPEFDRASADALLSAYAAASGSEPVLEPGFFATAVATHLNVLRVMADRVTDEPEHRAYAAEQVHALLDHDLTALRLGIDAASSSLGL